MLKSKFAFSFAEILIVLVIIGAIAVLTIFMFKSEVISIDRTIRVKKAYSMLMNAYKFAIPIKGTIIDWTEVSPKVVAENISKYLHVTENCATNILEPKNTCIPGCPNLYKTNGETLNTCASSDVSKFRTVDGFSYAFQIEDSSCSINALSEENKDKPSVLRHICGTALVDTHSGFNSLDLYGADLHLFYITRDGFFPVGLEDDSIYPLEEEKCTIKITQDVIGCCAKLIFSTND